MSEPIPRYAVISQGTVENIILWDGMSPWTPPEGKQLILIDEEKDIEACIGGTWSKGKFGPIPTPEKAEATQLEPELPLTP